MAFDKEGGLALYRYLARQMARREERNVWMNLGRIFTRTQRTLYPGKLTYSDHRQTGKHSRADQRQFRLSEQEHADAQKLATWMSNYLQGNEAAAFPKLKGVRLCTKNRKFLVVAIKSLDVYAHVAHLIEKAVPGVRIIARPVKPWGDYSLRTWIANDQPWTSCSRPEPDLG